MSAEEARQVLEALKAVDALIRFQYTGSYWAMNALQHAADDAHAAIEIMKREIAQATNAHHD